jgi:hypothetical protein
MSLLYECIYTVITGGFLEAAGESGNALAATCTNKLRKFLEDPDQNCEFNQSFLSKEGSKRLIIEIHSEICWTFGHGKIISNSS